MTKLPSDKVFIEKCALYLKYLRWGAECLVAYFFFTLFWILPYRAASNLGGAIGTIFGPLSPVNDRVERNLMRAIPSLTGPEREQIIIDIWSNFGRVLAEYPHLYKFKNKKFFNKYVKVENPQLFNDIVTKKILSIMVSGHFGNWEFNAIAAYHFNLILKLIYRRPNNYWLDGLLKKMRGEGTFAFFHPKGKEGAKALISSLGKKESVGMLADQKMNNGIASPFFGMEAMSPTAPAEFALKYKAKIYITRVIRRKGCYFTFEIQELNPRTPAALDKEAQVQWVTDKINAQFEEWIKDQPGQWLWMHNRFPK
jgi:KDO2-lipid IV(A) lauroyltransferase